MNIPRNRVFWSVALGHMTNDIFMSMGPVLLAFIGAVYFPVSPAQIGIAVSARQMIGGISQPLFGWLSDRGSSRLLGAGGVALTVSLLALSAFLAMVGSFWLMIIPYALSALGSGAFHPVGTAYASYKNRETASTNTAYFFLFGQFGLALGPALAGFLLGLTQTGGEGGSLVPILVLSLAAIPSVLFMNSSIPLHHGVPTPDKADSPANAAPAPKAVKTRPLAFLAVMVALRAIAHPGSVAFIPALFQAKGWSPAAYGGITSTFWLASAIAGVLFGNLADRTDRRYVVVGSLLLAVPVFFLLPSFDGGLAYVMVIAAGGLVGGSHSIIVVLAQSMLPGRKGLASGMALGYIFGVGSLGTLLIGYMADGAFGLPGVGLERAFQIISGFVLVSALFGVLLPPTERPVAVPAAELKPEGAD
jgi:FSR family fosmidomycin resistance protein-like MFS transporter